MQETNNNRQSAVYLPNKPASPAKYFWELKISGIFSLQEEMQQKERIIAHSGNINVLKLI